MQRAVNNECDVLYFVRRKCRLGRYLGHWGTWARTFDDHVLDSLLLGAALAAPFALLPQLGQNVGPHALDDPRQHGLSWVEQPGMG